MTTQLHAVVTADDGRYQVRWSDGVRAVGEPVSVYATPRPAIRHADALDPLPTAPTTRPRQETPSSQLGSWSEVTPGATEMPATGPLAEEIAGAAALTASTSVSSASGPSGQLGLF